MECGRRCNRLYRICWWRCKRSNNYFIYSWNTDKIEVLICVAAKDAKSVSELSTSVVYRNEIDEAKVQEVIEKFNLPATGYEESVKELAYALAKYNVTPEELLALAMVAKIL